MVPLELSTGERAVSRSEVKVEEKSLAPNFILAMKENSLHDILDDRIRHEVADEEFRHLKLSGKNRPAMKEVTVDLEKIRRLSLTCSRCADPVSWSTSMPCQRKDGVGLNCKFQDNKLSFILCCVGALVSWRMEDLKNDFLNMTVCVLLTGRKEGRKNIFFICEIT